MAGGAIMLQPNVPLHLPGHRALVWLALLLAVRLLNGAGWAAGVGVVSAGAALLLGGSPHEVAQYAAAGVLLDVALWARPGLAEQPGPLVMLAAGVSLAVSWIAPQSQSMGPVGFVVFAAVGAVAGLAAWGLVALGRRESAPIRRSPDRPARA